VSLQPGVRIGPYEVISLIGEGGMGKAYRATDTNLKRTVAIKVLPDSLAGDPERLARFTREAQLLASLNHSNIARRGQGANAAGRVGRTSDGTCYRPPQAEATMIIARTLTGFVCVAFACASVMLQAQANQGRGQAQGQAGRAAGQGGQPQGRGQASDEANRGKVEQVKTGQQGFVTIFDGTSMKGWSVSGKSRHSNVSKNASGATWVIRDGVLIGNQDVPGNGGLFITDQKYGDFEVVLDMRNDFGMDSGIYLRSTEDGTVRATATRTTRNATCDTATSGSRRCAETCCLES
jgi:3-keto-disaccharide hydrolase/Protein kinase domain